jgi:hypothetical protein
MENNQQNLNQGKTEVVTAPAQPANKRLDLATKEAVDLLTRTITQLELDNEVYLAWLLVKKMERRIKKEALNIPGQFLQAYDGILLRAKFLCLDLLEPEEIEGLLTNRLVAYWQMPLEHVDVLEKFRQSFTRFIFPPDTEPFINKLAAALRKNEEILGSKNIVFNDGQSNVSFKPTVANWLKDYLSFQVGIKVSGGADQKGGSTFGRVSYMNRVVSKYGLTKEQNELLIKVLELEDWLKSGWVKDFEEYSKPSGSFVTPEEIKAAVLSIKLPEGEEEPEDEIADDEEVLGTAARPLPKIKLPPSIPVPKNAPTLRPISEITKPIASSKNLKPEAGQIIVLKETPPPVNKERQPFVSAAPLRPINIQDILKKREQEGSVEAGLRIGSTQGQNTFAKPKSSPTPPPDIDKKLEELQKKLKN